MHGRCKAVAQQGASEAPHYHTAQAAACQRKQCTPYTERRSFISFSDNTCVVQIFNPN